MGYAHDLIASQRCAGWFREGRFLLTRIGLPLLAQKFSKLVLRLINRRVVGSFTSPSLISPRLAFPF